MSPRAGVFACLLALLLTACTSGGADKDPARGSSSSPSAVPELEREWEMTSMYTIPQSWNEHYWLSDFSYYVGDAGGTTRSSTGLKMFEAQSGKKIALDLGGNMCGVYFPALRPGDTHFVVPLSDGPADNYASKFDYQSGQTSPVRQCTGLSVYDATTGHNVWEWPPGTTRPIRHTTVNGTAVQVFYANGKAGCFSLEDGSRLSLNNDEDCAGVDLLPALLDEHGAPLKKLIDQKEIARSDGVVLVVGQLPLTYDEEQHMSVNGEFLVRAHDLETGLTLWVDTLDPDLGSFDAWDRTETYAATSDSLLHIRYEFEEQEGDGSQEPQNSDAAPTFIPTFAFISRVDPRTGEEQSQVGKVAGGLFLAQVGDTAVMGVDQEEGSDSLAGFRIPAAG